MTGTVGGLIGYVIATPTFLISIVAFFAIGELEPEVLSLVCCVDMGGFVSCGIGSYTGCLLKFIAC